MSASIVLVKPHRRVAVGLAYFSVADDNRAAMRRTPLVPVLALVASGWSAPASAEQYPPPVPGGPPAEARFTIKVDKGFIDDPLALEPESGLLAILLTDAASFARIDLIDLTSGKPLRSIALRDPQRQFERLAIAPGGKGVVLVSRDAGSGRRSAQYFDAAGKPARLVGRTTTPRSSACARAVTTSRRTSACPIARRCWMPPPAPGNGKPRSATSTRGRLPAICAASYPVAACLPCFLPIRRSSI
jgi:hypothetical protein